MTLMNMASFMVLMAPWNSVHSGEIVHLDGMTCGAGLVIDGEGALRCSLYLSPKVLPVLPIYSTIHPGWSIIPEYYPSFAGDVVLVLGGH